LLSKRVAEDLAQSRRWTPYLHDLGECAVKHGVPIFLVNFFGDDFGNPGPPKVIQHARAEEAARAAATGALSRFRRVYIAIAAAIFFATVTGLSIWFYFRPPPAASLPEEKSIAVLPFENFSPERDNAFFADGIQDDILTSLAKIRDLRVISRSSVMAFRDAAAHNAREPNLSKSRHAAGGLQDRRAALYAGNRARFEFCACSCAVSVRLRCDFPLLRTHRQLESESTGRGGNCTSLAT